MVAKRLTGAMENKTGFFPPLQWSALGDRLKCQSPQFGSEFWWLEGTPRFLR